GAARPSARARRPQANSPLASTRRPAGPAPPSQASCSAVAARCVVGAGELDDPREELWVVARTAERGINIPRDPPPLGDLGRLERDDREPARAHLLDRVPPCALQLLAQRHRGVPRGFGERLAEALRDPVPRL